MSPCVSVPGQGLQARVRAVTDSVVSNRVRSQPGWVDWANSNQEFRRCCALIAMRFSCSVGIVSEPASSYLRLPVVPTAGYALGCSNVQCHAAQLLMFANAASTLSPLLSLPVAPPE